MEERDKSMLWKYGTFHCRICGGKVFVPLPWEAEEGQRSNGRVELTCTRGHTDAFALSDLKMPEGIMQTETLVSSAVAGG